MIKKQIVTDEAFETIKKASGIYMYGWVGVVLEIANKPGITYDELEFDDDNVDFMIQEEVVFEDEDGKLYLCK